MQTHQINRHADLFAYKFLDIVSKNDKKNIKTVNFKEVKSIVGQDFERIGAFSDPEKLIKLDNQEQFAQIGGNIPITLQDTHYLYVPKGAQLDQIIASADCRNGAKFPMMTFINKQGNCLWRASEIK